MAEEKKQSGGTSKPRLTFWEIWNMSFGFLGIQFGFALQNANVSRIFETLGASIENIPILWIAAPVTGLIVQPIIGYMSDNTWNRLGRRRPYFLVGAILASLSLIVMPNSPYLWVAAGMLWIMDASINVSMEPFRAFVGDMLPSEQRTKGFAMQSFFIGTGAVIASALPYIMTNWIGVSNTAPSGEIPPSVKYSFYIGAFAFLTSVIWTVVSTREYSPEELARFEEEETDEEQAEADRERRKALQSIRHAYRKIWYGIGIAIAGLILTWVVYQYALAKEVYIFSVGLAAFGLLLIFAGWMQKKGETENGIVVVLTDFLMMPRTMVQLSFVQFFSWFALFAMWIYTTAGVTSHIYDMKMDAGVVNQLETALEQVREDQKQEYENLSAVTKELNTYKSKLNSGQSQVVASMKVVKFFLDENKEDLSVPEEARNRLTFIQEQYNTGADWVGIAFAVYNGFAAVVAFLLPVVSKYTNRRITHFISLLAGAVGLGSLYFISDPMMILVSMLGVGLAWASILAMPYAILAGALPADKMGIYMGIFNFFIVLPQILAATILGFFTETLFDGQAIFALMLGGASWVLAGVITLFVEDVDEEAASEAAPV